MNEDKVLVYGDVARKHLKEGMSIVANAVRTTMGPSGRNVVIENGYIDPIITKDGVTVARNIKLKDNLQNIGAQLIKSVSSRTADTSGDGTSSSTVLAYNMFDVGLNDLDQFDNLNVNEYKMGMDHATKDVIEKVKEVSIECNSVDMLYEISMISSNGDVETSKLVSEAVMKVNGEVGSSGIINVDISTDGKEYVEYNESVVIGNGYVDYRMVNKPEDYTYEATNPLVFVYNGGLINITSIAPILDHVIKTNTPLVIFAKDFDVNFVSNIVTNIMKREIGLNCVLIRAPEFGKYQKDILLDISNATGAVMVEEQNNGGVININAEHLGVASFIKATDRETFLTVGYDYSNTDNPEMAEEQKKVDEELKENLMKYVKGLSSLRERTSKEFEKTKLTKRIDNLSGMNAKIVLSGVTTVELNERKQRTEDAISATKSALEEGIVIGGGLTLMRTSINLEKTKLPTYEEDRTVHFLMGYKNILESIKMPYKQIRMNASMDIDSTIEKEFHLSDLNDIGCRYGYNIRTREFKEDLLADGVIDPTKVIRCSLENANSISSTALTTECLIVSAEYDEEFVPQDFHSLD